MDFVDQLNRIQDLGLRELLTHSVRYSLQHSLIASQCEASEDPNAKNAMAIHKDTNMLMLALVKRILADNPPVEDNPQPVPTKRAAKKK